MTVPPKRRASSNKWRRRSHQALIPLGYQACPKCKKPVRAHRVCGNCGTYKGKTVIDTNKKLKKIAKKKK